MGKSESYTLQSQGNRALLPLPAIDTADRPAPVPPWTSDPLLGMCRIDPGHRVQQSLPDIKKGRQLPELLSLRKVLKDNRVKRTFADIGGQRVSETQEPLPKDNQHLSKRPKRKHRPNRHFYEFWIPRMPSLENTMSNYGDQMPGKLVLPAIPKAKGMTQTPDDHGYDTSDDDLTSSMTLPTIAAVLKAEGIQPHSITQQIEKFKASRKPKNDLRFKKAKWKAPVKSKPSKLKPPKEPESKVHLDGGLDFLTPRDADAPETNNAKDALHQYYRDIEETRWLSQQQIEKGLMGFGFVPPRIVIIASNVPDSEVLGYAVKEDSSIYYIQYDYEKNTVEDILEKIDTKLESHKIGCRAQSMLFYCRGGAGYVYLLKKFLLTSKRLERYEELSSFWKAIGSRISKINKDDAAVHFMGFDLLSDAHGEELLSNLETLVYPSKVEFLNAKEDSKLGQNILNSYFDIDLYNDWKATG